MLKNIQVNIMEKSLITVTERDTTFEYARQYLSNALPVYTPPKEKNIREGFKLDEFLFLPLSNDKMKLNREDYFFGYRFLISNNNMETIGLIFDPKNTETTLRMQFEICRIRYYPTGEKSITIDHHFDSLIPTQEITSTFPTREMIPRVLKNIDDILSLYCAYYIDKRI